MIGEPARLTARRRDDVYIHITVVIPAERNHRTVGREKRAAFQVAPAYQPTRFASGPADDPYIASVDERDLGCADCRSLGMRRALGDGATAGHPDRQTAA